VESADLDQDPQPAGALNRGNRGNSGVRRAGAGGPAQRYGAERLLEMAAGGRAAQQAALGSSEALKALLERVLSGRLQARDCGLPTRAVCFTWGWALERCAAYRGASAWRGRSMLQGALAGSSTRQARLLLAPRRNAAPGARTDVRLPWIMAPGGHAPGALRRSSQSHGRHALLGAPL